VQGALLERKKIGGNFLQSIEREKKVQVTEKHNPPRIQVTLASSSNAGTLYCHKFEELTTPAIYHHCSLSSLDEVGDGRADCGDLDGVRAVPRDRQRGLCHLPLPGGVVAPVDRVRGLRDERAKPTASYSFWHCFSAAALEVEPSMWPC
jgi:hypothetical protein